MISLSCSRCSSINGLTNFVGVFIARTFYRRIFAEVLITPIESSHAGESHPHVLTEPDMNVSTHPALIVQPPDDAGTSGQIALAGAALFKWLRLIQQIPPIAG